MNAQTPVAEKKNLPAIVAGGEVRAIVPQDFEGVWRFAKVIHAGGMAPTGIDTAEKAMVALLHGLEVGFTPMAAMQSIAVINNRPTIYGDGALALVRASGLLEWIKETYEGEGDALTAKCVVKRKNEAEPITGEFSIGDAKLADLLGKKGPWQQYRRRMLKMRARAFALRDGFSDVLRGMHIREEVEDYSNGKVVDHVQQDAGPPDPPPPPVTPAPPTQPTAPAEDVVDAEVVEIVEDAGPPDLDAAELTVTSLYEDGADPLDLPAILDRREKPAHQNSDRLKTNLLRDIETLDSTDDFLIWARDATDVIAQLAPADQNEVRNAFNARQDTVSRAERAP